MTRGEAVNWLINILADIGKAEHRELWHYEQALSEIREMLEGESECKTVSDEEWTKARGGWTNQPEWKTGKWEEREVSGEQVVDEWQSARCSVCGLYHTTPYLYYFKHYNYCPNCGAYMEGEQDE